MTDQKDETILALQEMVNELTNKIINLRVGAGVKIKELQAEIDNGANRESPAD